jgi:hypothetical protein
VHSLEMEIIAGLFPCSFPCLGLATLWHGVKKRGRNGARSKVRLQYQFTLAADVIFPRYFLFQPADLHGGLRQECTELLMCDCS